jgi:hypothetical protein
MEYKNEYIIDTTGNKESDKILTINMMYSNKMNKMARQVVVVGCCLSQFVFVLF